MSLILRHAITALQHRFRPGSQFALRELLLCFLSELIERRPQLAGTQHAFYMTNDGIDGVRVPDMIGQQTARAVGNFRIGQRGFQLTDASRSLLCLSLAVFKGEATRSAEDRNGVDC